MKISMDLIVKIKNTGLMDLWIINSAKQNING